MKTLRYLVALLAVAAMAAVSAAGSAAPASTGNVTELDPAQIEEAPPLNCPYADGLVCAGSAGLPGDSKTLDVCRDGEVVQVIKCPNACVSNGIGQDDQCA